jgi:hypothetical protein
MSNVIGFLEAMGQDAGLRHASRGMLYDAMNEQSVDIGARWAILSGDDKQIETLLDAPRIACCVFAPGKNPDDESEEAPSKDDDEITGRSDVRVMANAA